MNYQINEIKMKRASNGFRIDLFSPLGINEIRSKLIKGQKIISYEDGKPFYTREISSYKDYPQTLAWMQKMQKAFPSLVKIRNLSSLFKLGKTAKENQIYALQITNNQRLSSLKPKLLFIGQHHARELMTHHAVMDTAEYFLRQTSRSPRKVQEWLKKVDLWFVPVVNPDGLNFVFSHNRWWRKNLSTYPGSNHQGVDLNRNYAFKWGACGNYSTSPGSEIYLGPKANSEHEVQVMDALNKNLKFQYVISFHSHGDEVLYPYRCGKLLDKDIYLSLRDRLAKELGYRHRLASSSGEDFEHHFAKHGSLSFLIEIGQDFQPNYETYLKTVQPKVLKILPFLLNELKSPGVNLRVLSKADQKPLAHTQVTIQSFQGVEKEIRETDIQGVFRRRLPLGKYTIRLSKKGYQDKVINFEVSQAELRLKTFYLNQ
jgi:hypothetical protein